MEGLMVVAACGTKMYIRIKSKKVRNFFNVLKSYKKGKK